MSIAAMRGRTTAPGLRQPMPMPWLGSPLAQTFRFQLASGARVQPKPMLSLRPRHEMPMILQTVR